MSPDDPHRAAVRVAITDAVGRPLRKPALARWLQSAAPRSARGEVTLALVSDAHIRRLNRQFARVDHATDVLSFPTEELAAASSPRSASPRRRHAGQEKHLGDIVIATGVAARQARGAGHSLDTELRILALHGLLHLLGYDHTIDNGRMARLERRLRRKGGLDHGLIDRADRVGRTPRSALRARRRSAR